MKLANNNVIRTEKYSINELMRDYNIYECIGRDSLSSVFKAKDTRTRSDVTLLFLYRLVETTSDRKDFIQLLTTVSHLQHPLLTSIQQAYVPLDLSDMRIPFSIQDVQHFSRFNLSPIIRTDFIKNGQLSIHTKLYLRSQGRVSQKVNPTVRSKVIFGIASLMKYLHGMKIQARQLKFEKIYLNDKLEPVFVNVGFDFFGPMMKDVEYMELGGDEFKNEVFQFAIVIYKMFSLVKLVSNERMDVMNYLFKVKNGWRPDKPDLMPECYWNLVSKCWDQNQNKRPSFDEIVDTLKNDMFAIDEFGMNTDRNDLHEYQSRVENRGVKLNSTKKK